MRFCYGSWIRLPLNQCFYPRTAILLRPEIYFHDVNCKFFIVLFKNIFYIFWWIVLQRHLLEPNYIFRKCFYDNFSFTSWNYHSFFYINLCKLFLPTYNVNSVRGFGLCRMGCMPIYLNCSTRDDCRSRSLFIHLKIHGLCNGWLGT